MRTSLCVCACVCVRVRGKKENARDQSESGTLALNGDWTHVLRTNFDFIPAIEFKGALYACGLCVWISTIFSAWCLVDAVPGWRLYEINDGSRRSYSQRETISLIVHRAINDILSIVKRFAQLFCRWYNRIRLYLMAATRIFRRPKAWQKRLDQKSVEIQYGIENHV